MQLQSFKDMENFREWHPNHEIVRFLHFLSCIPFAIANISLEINYNSKLASNSNQHEHYDFITQAEMK